MGMSVDRIKNQSRGAKGTAKESLYFKVGSDSSSSEHEITLNYDTGHFCSCRGMIAKIRKFKGVGGMEARQSLTLPQTSRHWCKHVHAVRSAPADFRIEARHIRNEAFGISEDAIDPETGQGTQAAPARSVGRRAAVAATAAKRKAQSPADRLAEIDREREALLAEVSQQQTELRDTLAALVDAHGKDAIRDALKGAA